MGTEEESKDPENASFAMPIQGVLSKMPRVSLCRSQTSYVLLGQNIT